jgi:hypothetical protein
MVLSANSFGLMREIDCWYVYELIDPRDQRTFYVGKGIVMKDWFLSLIKEKFEWAKEAFSKFDVDITTNSSFS